MKGDSLYLDLVYLLNKSAVVHSSALYFSIRKYYERIL